VLQNYSAKSVIILALGEIIKRGKVTTQAEKGTPTTITSFKSPTVSQIGSMKDVFIKSLNDSDSFTRMEAIKGLGILGDTSVIPLLKPIAKNDPRAWNTVSGDPSKFVYPVREEAQRVLKLLEEKKKEEKSKKQEVPNE